MKFCFHPRADEEFDEAVRYYEERQRGLGIEFAKKFTVPSCGLVNIQTPGLSCRG